MIVNLLILILMVFSTQGNKQVDDDLKRILEELDTLKNKLMRAEKTIEEQRDLIKSNEHRTSVLETKQETTVKEQQTKIMRNENRINTMKNMIMQYREASTEKGDTYTNKTMGQCTSTAYAFSARLAAAIDISAGERVVYGRVDYNFGNFYNPSTGVFTTPSTGPYLVLVNFMTIHNERGEIHIRKNNESNFGSVLATGSQNEYGQGGNSYIFELNQGDSVYINTLGNIKFHSGTWNTFTIIQL